MKLAKLFLTALCNMLLIALIPKLDVHADDSLPPEYKPHPALLTIEQYKARGGELYYSPDIDSFPEEMVIKADEKAQITLGVEEKDESNFSLFSPAIDHIFYVVASKAAANKATLGETTNNKSARLDGWLLNGTTGKLKLLFQTNYIFDYEWISNRYILAKGACYGDPPKTFDWGRGIYIVDTQRGTVRVIDSKWSNCESDPIIRNEYGHLVLMNDLIDPSNRNRKALCPQNETLRSSAWSHTGRFLYVACYGSGNTDQLRRLDMKTGRFSNLSNRKSFVFKASDMWVSDSNRFLFFEWGDDPKHSGYPNYERKTWVIDLAKLKPKTTH